MDTIKIYQMQDTTVTVVVRQAFAEVMITFRDREGNPVELYMDMESGLKVIRDFDRFPDVAPDMSVSPFMNVREKFDNPWVTAAMVSCLIAWFAILNVYLGTK